jgi:ADP-heptose:LPS heptosyltransferase
MSQLGVTISQKSWTILIMHLRNTFANLNRVSALFVNGLGDHFLALPAIRALTALWPNKLTLYVARYGKNEIWSSLPLFDLVRLDFRSQEEHRWFNVSAIADSFWRSELFISLVPWMNASLQTAAGALPRSCLTIGYHSIFSYQLPLDFTRHSSDLYFDSVRCCAEEANILDYASPATFSVEASAFAEDIRELLPKGAKLMAVHLDTLPDKQWSSEKARNVIVRWLDADSSRYAVMVGSRDVLSEEPIVHERHIPLVPDISFYHSAALVSRADIFFGVDSCFHHVADLARVPSVCLFGPTRHEEFGCRWCVHEILQSRTGSMDDIGTNAALLALERISAESLKPRSYVHLCF